MFMKFKIVELDSFRVTNIRYYEIFYEKRFISIFIHFANGNYPKTLKIMRWAIKTIFIL